MFARELSGGISALVPYWFHVAVHVASIAWYYAIKHCIGRASPASIMRMCMPAIWLSLFHGAVMAMNGSLSWMQGLIGIAVNVGLMLLFVWRYTDAQNEAAR